MDCGQPFWRQLLGAGLGATILCLFAPDPPRRHLPRRHPGHRRPGLQPGPAPRRATARRTSSWPASSSPWPPGSPTVLCFLPGILIAFLTSYTLFFIVDQQLEAAEAIAESVKLVWHNFGKALLFFILAAIVVAIGFIALIVGLLVAVPVVVIGFAYTYRRLQGQPVVP